MKDNSKLEKCPLEGCHYIYEFGESLAEKISHFKRESLPHPSTCLYCHKVLFTDKVEHIMRVCM